LDVSGAVILAISFAMPSASRAGCRPARVRGLFALLPLASPAKRVLKFVFEILDVARADTMAKLNELVRKTNLTSCLSANFLQVGRLYGRPLAGGGTSLPGGIA
jgi:hypothetical protein